MKLSTAVARKINDILIEKKMSVNKLASISCLTQSTVDSIVNESSKNPKLLTDRKSVV